MKFFEKIFSVFKKKWFWWLLGLILVSIIVWFVFPLITFGGVTPFSVSVRLFILLILVITWSVINIILLRKAKAEELQNKEELDPKELTDALNLLKLNFSRALEIVGLGSFFEKYIRRHAYVIPWYMMVGEAQSGRSSLLRHSNLPYPVANETYQQIEHKENESCQWWFSKEAVFIDTHADLVTNLDEESISHQVFNRLLKLLKFYRPRQPLNGVVLTIDIHNLLQKDARDRATAAHALRLQLQKINKSLGIQCPTYVVFTKLDLLSGFSEFFNDLDEIGRKSLMGFTFKYHSQTDAVKDFAERFEQLIEQLNRHLIGHLHQEKDPKKAALLNNFILELYIVKETLTIYLQEIFESSHFHQQLALRGVFFTSSQQQGIPLDCLANTSKQTYGIDVVNERAHSGRKNYFIYGIFAQVIFSEKDALLFNAQQKLKRQRWRYTIHGLFIVFILFMIMIWMNSFVQNNQRLNVVQESIQNFSATPGDMQSQNNSLLYVLPMLDSLANMSGAYDTVQDPLSVHWGLYQGYTIDSVADEVYRQNLLIYLMPYVLTVVNTVLQDPNAKPNELYNALRVYLMLANPDKLSKDFAESWLSTYWQQKYHGQNDVLDSLNNNFANLLNLKIKPITVDAALVASVRERLRNTTQAQRDYFQLQEVAGLDNDQQLHISNGVDSDFNQVFGISSSSLEVPYLYTHSGYKNIYKPQLQYVLENESYNTWVLGESASQAVGVQPSKGEIANQVRDLYMRDYVVYWNKIISGLQIQSFTTLKQAGIVLNIVSSQASPIYNAMEAIYTNTALSSDASSAGGNNTANLQKQMKANQSLINALQPSGVRSITSGAKRFQPKNANRTTTKGLRPVNLTPVDITFAPIISLFESSGSSSGAGAAAGAPIDNIMGMLVKLNDYIMNINTAPNADELAYQLVIKHLGTDKADDILGQLQAQAAAAPQPLRGWLQAIVGNTWGALLSSAASYVNTQYQAQLWPAYSSVIQGRYPIERQAKDSVALADFSDFFQANGKIDSFFNQYLKQFVDTSKPHWAWKAINGKSIAIPMSVLEQFQRANQIQQALLTPPGAPPKASFSLQVLSLSADLTGAIMNLNGQVLEYRHGPRRSMPFTWQAAPGSSASYTLVLQNIANQNVQLQGSGDWGLFALIDQARIMHKPGSSALILTYSNNTVSYQLSSDTSINPFDPNLIAAFRLPSDLRG